MGDNTEEQIDDQDKELLQSLKDEFASITWCHLRTYSSILVRNSKQEY